MRRWKQRVAQRDLRQFRVACGILQALCAQGYDIYVAGSGSFHLMRGESHDEKGAHPERSVACHVVDRASGGDW